MKIDIEERRILTIEVDSDEMVEAHSEVWVEFLADYELGGENPDLGEARKEYVSDWINEVGLDDFLDNDFVEITFEDSDLDVDVKK